MSALLTLLDPDVVLRADAFAVQMSAQAGAGAPVLAPATHGAAAVAGAFSGRARAARLALIEGAPGAVFAPGGNPAVVFAFAIEAGRIVEIEIIADPAALGGLDVKPAG